MIVDVVVEDDRWAGLGLVALAEAACHATLDHLGVGEGELAILACDDARIAALNGAFRNKGQPTNVLSWPSEERGAVMAGGLPLPPIEPELGDIAISFDSCAREAEAAGRQMTAHVTHLIVHATLHLLGYDHIDDKDAALMEGLEVEILGKLGLPNPYGEAEA